MIKVIASHNGLAAAERAFQRLKAGVPPLDAVVEGVRSTRSDAAMLAVFLYSVLEWVLICACYWCLARAFEGQVNLSLVDVFIIMGFVSFGSIVQIPGVGEVIPEHPPIIETAFGKAAVTHVSLNDRSIEGLACMDQPVFSVQYHPEASPGPHDSAYLFTEFVQLMEKSNG